MSAVVDTAAPQTPDSVRVPGEEEQEFRAVVDTAALQTPDSVRVPGEEEQEFRAVVDTAALHPAAGAHRGDASATQEGR
jgi:hypothetical protein